MSLIASDIRLGLRMLRTSPAFTLMAVAILALAIGAATAIASLAEAIFLRPVAGADAAGVIELAPTRNGQVREPTVSWDRYTYLRDGSLTLAGLAAHYSTAPLNFADGGASREINGAVVTASYFTLLGVRPALGRFFTSDDDVPHSPSAVAVISHDFWQHQWLARPDVIGRSIELNGVTFTVIGIAPPDFHGVNTSIWNDLWIPISMLPVGYRWCDDAFAASCTVLRLFGRPGQDVTPARAGAEMDVLLHRLDNVTSDRTGARGEGMIVRRMRGMQSGFERRENAKSIALLLSAAGLLLLIACANLAGTLLSRGMARSREIAIRLSIGGGAGRVSRQLLIEGVVLAIAGGLAGIVVALWAQQLLTTLWTADSEGYIRHLDVRLDALVLTFAIALSLLTGVAFSLLPALRCVRIDLMPALKGQERAGRSRFAIRDGLIAAQIALSFPALACAGLLVRSMLTVRDGAGFDIEHVALMRLRPRLVGYDAAKARVYTQEVLRRLDALPAVQSASLVGEFGGVWGSGVEATVWLPASPPVADSLASTAHFSEIAPRFFETLGVPLLEGREFDAGDRVGAERVAIVNRSFVRRFLRGRAVGQSIVVNGGEARIIGVIPDAHFRNAGEPALPFVYEPWLQDAGQIDARLAIRVNGDPRALLPDLVRMVNAVDPVVPVAETLPLRTQIEAAFSQVRLTAGTLFWAGMLAIALCALGIYGALSFAVNARRRELAIRMSIGARGTDIARALLGRTAVVAAVGLGAGFLLAIACTRLFANLVYGVGLANPLVFSVAALLLVLVIAIGSWLPARAAMRVHPRETLIQT